MDNQATEGSSTKGKNKGGNMKTKFGVMVMSLLFIGISIFTASCAKKQIASPPAPIDVTETDMSYREGTYEERSTIDDYEQKKETEYDSYDRTQDADLLAKQQEEQRQMEFERRNQFLNEKIYFDFDSATLDYQAQEILRKKADYMMKNPNVTITIAGHCDERGTNEYNLALGDRRAESAKAFLVNIGISPSRVDTVSYGEERPADPGHNETAWAKNRRAEFVIR